MSWREIADALIETRFVTRSRLVRIDLRNSLITSKPSFEALRKDCRLHVQLISTVREGPLSPARLCFRKARRDSNAVTNRVEFGYNSPGERKTMRRYHHIGIPTTESKPGETHLEDLKLFVVSHQKSEFGVEWMRFEADAAVPDLVRRVAHVAFEVTDLSSELAGREILIPPNSPSDGVRVAFIVEN